MVTMVSLRPFAEPGRAGSSVLTEPLQVRGGVLDLGDVHLLHSRGVDHGHDGHERRYLNLSYHGVLR